MIYGNILPIKAAVSRIMIKSLLGVFIGNILFSVLCLAFVYFFADTVNMDISAYEILAEIWSVIIGVIIWTMMFAAIPTLLGSVLLSGVIYRDFKLGNPYKNIATKKGALFGGITGLSVSFFVVFIMFDNHFTLAILLLTIFIALIASLIGVWGGSQVYKEIAVEFSLRGDLKENSQ